MNISTKVIPQHTIDTLAKGLYREAIRYGFERKDILRFVNSLLKLTMASTQDSGSFEKERLLPETQLVSCEKSKNNFSTERAVAEA